MTKDDKVRLQELKADWWDWDSKRRRNPPDIQSAFDLVSEIPWLIKRVEELEAQITSMEEEVEKDGLVCKTMYEENKQLKAQNGELGEALEKVASIHPTASCRDGQGLIATNAIATKALATTPQDAGVYVKKLEAENSVLKQKLKKCPDCGEMVYSCGCLL